MKIAEMNACIEKMRELYNFDDEKTEIIVGVDKDTNNDSIMVRTIDDNGTEVIMRRHN